MLHIILPVHNRRSVTERFCKTLMDSEYKDWVLVLIDDGSSDGTQFGVQKLITADKLVILQGDGQLWWGGGLQFAYEMYLKKLHPTENLLIINDDVAFDKDYISTGLNLLEMDGDAIIASLPFCSVKGEFVDYGMILNEKMISFSAAGSLAEEINCFSTRGVFLKAKIVKELKGFDCDNFPHYLSDYDFVYRFCKKGGRIVRDKRLRVEVFQHLTGAHELPSLLDGANLIRALKDKKNALNYSAWTRFIAKHTSNWCYFCLSYVRYHLLVLKKVLHF